MTADQTSDSVLELANPAMDIFREFSEFMQHQVQNTQASLLINSALENVSRVLSAGTITLFDVEIRDGKSHLHPRRSVSSGEPGEVRPSPGCSFCLEDAGLDEWNEELVRGNVVYAKAASSLPRERQYLADRGIASAAFIPLFVQGMLKGVVEIGDCALRESHEELLPRVFQLLGNVLAYALEQEGLTERFERMHNELYEIRVMRDTVQKQLQELLEWKQTVFSNFAHEFQTPLYTLLGFSATLMENESLDEDREIRAVCLRHIFEQATRLENLVKELLGSARVHEGPAPETFTDVSLRGILTNLLDGFTADAKQRNVDVYFEAGDAPMTARCDKASVTDMLSLLLKHSLKATQSGGWISIRIADDGKNIVLVISDNGVGIPSERLDTVFEPFGQAFPLLKNRTGDVLGLSRVKDVVDLHRGFITVESRHGEGSEFTIILPKDPRTASGPSQ